MKSKLLLLTLSASILSFNTIADDGVIRAKVGLSTNSFDSLWSGGDLTADYQAVNLGVSYITSSMYYADLGLKKNLNGNWEAETPWETMDEDYDRTDYTLTFGKVLSNGIQLFAGYQNSTAIMDVPDSYPVPDEKIKIAGFFAGVGKSFNFENSSLNINFAFGQMDGELTDGRGFKHDSGDGSGHSFGATYTYFLSGSSTISAEFKQQSYSYTYPDDAPLTGGDDKASILGVNYNRTF